MGLRPNEISALIKEQIKHYDDIIEQKDVGTVVTVGDGVSVIHGLDNAMLVANPATASAKMIFFMVEILNIQFCVIVSDGCKPVNSSAKICKSPNECK